MVTICTVSLTFNNSTFCPHSVFMCFVWISEQTAIISLYSINWLVFITETESVYCAVRTVYLNIIQIKFMFELLVSQALLMCAWTQTRVQFRTVEGIYRILVPDVPVSWDIFAWLCQDLIIPFFVVYSMLKLSWTGWTHCPHFPVECMSAKRKLEHSELCFVFHKFSKGNWHHCLCAWQWPINV